MGMLMSRVINNNRYKQNVQGRCSTLNIICKSPKGGGTISHSSSVERVTLQYKNTDVGINLLEEINNLKEERNNLKEERNNLKEKNNLKEERNNLKEKINNLKEKINNFNTKQKINQFSKKKLINSRVAAVDNTTKQCAREKRKQEEEMGKHVDNGRTKVVRADEEEEEEEEERSRKKRKWCEEVKEGEACGAKYERKEVEEEKELLQLIIRQSSVLGKKGKQEEEMGKHVDNGRTKVVRAKSANSFGSYLNFEEDEELLPVDFLLLPLP